MENIDLQNETGTQLKRIKNLHVMTGFSPQYGGVYQVVALLTKNLQKNAEISILSTYRDNHFNPIATPGIHHFYVKTWRKYQFSFEVKKHLEQLIPNYDIIHIHSLWQFPLSYAATVARSKKIPYVYHVHGMLDPWPIQYHRWRKKIYLAIWEKENLNKASRLICGTEKEREYITRLGITASIVIIPNGIDRSFADHLPPKERFFEKHPQFINKTIVLFLGRIHPKKGIDLLIQAFHKLFQPPGPMHLIIAGPEEDKAYAKRLKGMVSSFGINEGVTFLGPVFGEDKRELLTASDLFVLPSHAEGFSLAVLEALAAGLPVIITDNCNFPEVERFKAGLVIPYDVNKLIEAMSYILVNEKLQAEMGSNGRKLILSDYQLDAIALRMLQVYRQVLENQKA